MIKALLQVLIAGLSIAILSYSLIIIRRYRRLPAALDSPGYPKVIVSMTTLPSHTKHLQAFLSAFEEQSLWPDLLIINIPWYSKREKKYYTVPELSGQLPILIQRCDDIGPLTKLLPSIHLAPGGYMRYDKDVLYNLCEWPCATWGAPFLLAAGTNSRSR